MIIYILWKKGFRDIRSNSFPNRPRRDPPKRRPAPRRRSFVWNCETRRDGKVVLLQMVYLFGTVLPGMDSHDVRHPHVVYQSRAKGVRGENLLDERKPADDQQLSQMDSWVSRTRNYAIGLRTERPVLAPAMRNNRPHLDSHLLCPSPARSVQRTPVERQRPHRSRRWKYPLSALAPPPRFCPIVSSRVQILIK